MASSRRGRGAAAQLRPSKRPTTSSSFLSALASPGARPPVAREEQYQHQYQEEEEEEEGEEEAALRIPRISSRFPACRSAECLAVADGGRVKNLSPRRHWPCAQRCRIVAEATLSD